MPDQTATAQNIASPQPPRRRGLRPTWIVMLVAAAGLTGAVATTAFSQGFGPGFGPHFSPWRGGMMGQVFDPARAEEHADRIVRHLAIELDASNEQTDKLRGIVKSTVRDIVPMRGRFLSTRTQGRVLLTEPTINRAEIERLRSEQVALADTFSKRVAQALGDAGEVLTAEQRRKLADRLPRRERFLRSEVRHGSGIGDCDKFERVTDRILLIEDDPRLAEMVKNYLGGAGFAVTIAGKGAAGIALEARETFDALILDLMLPDMDGLEVCRRVRARAHTPILMLTARGDAMDRVVGLEMGADDYLPKPFEPRELLARLKSILRRRHRDETDVLRYGRLEIDVAAREARLDGSACALTSYQFSMLLTLARHAGRVLSRDAIMELMKNERLEAFDRSIDVHISRIRAAIEDDPKKPRRVITVRGSGYVFAKAQD